MQRKAKYVGTISGRLRMMTKFYVQFATSLPRCVHHNAICTYVQQVIQESVTYGSM